MWNNVPATLAVVLPLCGVILTIALKVIYNKKRDVLPCCAERFIKIDNEMDAMKKGSTDRAGIVQTVQAAIQMVEDNIAENKHDYKELRDAISLTSKEVAVISTNIEYMKKSVEEIRQNGKKNG